MATVLPSASVYKHGSTSWLPGKASIAAPARRPTARAMHVQAVQTMPSAESKAQRAPTLPTPAALDAGFPATPCREQMTAIDLHVQGNVPKWLKGAYVKNGPGVTQGDHWFDGYGFLVKFAFDDGNVKLQHRFVESNAWKAYRDTGKAKFSEFATNVGATTEIWNLVLGKLGLGQGFTDNSSVSVIPVAGNPGVLQTMTESVVGTFLVDADSLQTRRRGAYDDHVGGDLTTAHPAVLLSGDLINLTSGLGTGYRVVRQKAGTQTRELIAKIPFRSGVMPSWIHDFPCTENYAVIPETPVIFNFNTFITGKTKYLRFDWKPEMGSLMHIVPLAGGQATSVQAPPYFTFHYVNAFEEDGQIHIDFGAYDDPDFLNNMLVSEIRAGTKDICPASFSRLSIPLPAPTQSDGAAHGAASSANGTAPSVAEGKFTRLMADDSEYVMIELARVNPAFLGKKYQYAYGLAAKRPTTLGNALGKYDITRPGQGAVQLWHEAGSLPSEPLFVAAPEPKTEDDGVVFSVVAGRDGNSFLLLLDGPTFQEIARCHVPYGLPHGFHGTFVHAP